MFHRAWDIIAQDKSIEPDEKEGILKLIQVLVEAAEASPTRQEKITRLKPLQEVIQTCPDGYGKTTGR